MNRHPRLRGKITIPLLVAATAVTAAVPAFAATQHAATQHSATHQQPRYSYVNPPPPAGFIENKVDVHGIGINYVKGGHGPTLILIHGYPETWYEWDPVLPALAEHYTVIAPDLPGAGGSDAPAPVADYTKTAMAADIYGLMVKLGLSDNVRIVGHDIGTMVAYSYAAAHPNDVAKLVLSEAPLPDSSIYTWPALSAKGPGLWWFGLFNEPLPLSMGLMSGKEEIWTTKSMPTLEVVKGALTPRDLAVATYSLREPGHLQGTIEWFTAFNQDVKDQATYPKLTMPVLAIGSSAVFGSFVANQVGKYATKVTPLVINDAGHWLYEEQPQEMTTDLLNFLN
jgi:pimeloyl-ACP methyl ester carboxylesterase